LEALIDREIRADRLRAEIAQLEARYDGVFPPGVYSVLVSLRLDLIALSKNVTAANDLKPTAPMYHREQLAALTH